jgi:hypothetical protein
MNQASQLTALAPASALAERVTVTSRDVRKEDNAAVENVIEHVVEPFTYRKLFKVLGHVNNVFAAIGGLDAINFDDEIALAKFIMQVTADAGDDVQAVVCMAIDRPVEYLDTLMPDDGIKLTAAVIRVNKDFFVQRILPMISTLKAEVMETSATLGETS